MAFDGCFLHNLIRELAFLEGSFVDKIHQPSKDELVFLLRSHSGTKRLFISAKQGSARIQITENAPENPAVPPMLCMLFRKHLGSSVLTGISQPELERVALLEFSATNEMGDKVRRTLAAEFIGTNPNIILIDENGRIIDCLRRSDLEKDSARMLQPGAIYKLPESSGKHSVLRGDISAVAKIIAECGELSACDAFIKTVAGVAPKTVRCLLESAKIDADEPISAAPISKIEAALCALSQSLSSERPTALYNEAGKLLDFSFIKGGGYAEEACGYSELLDRFYTERDQLARIYNKAHDLVRLVSNLKKRSEKKLALRINELDSCRDKETLRIYGELIKANLHAIPAGSSEALVCNYYDENMSTVKIPLDKALSPAANAAKYFKDYKKACTAEQLLTSLIEQNREELTYLDSVWDALQRADKLSLLEDIREELILSGYLKAGNTKGPKQKKRNTQLERFTSPSGLEVWLGKNNMQNDLLTTKLAEKTDIWFHTKNIPGSHVVISTSGKEVSDDDIVFAATLAAKNSKAASSSKVAVDYTMIKNVKKPAGAKPGMVIYKTNQTVLVDPQNADF